MTEKEFDYMQVGGLIDHRPFIVPGLINWMQASADPVHVTFLLEMPGVEGAQGIPAADLEMTVLAEVDSKWTERKQTFKTVVFNFASSAVSNYFTNEHGIGCMMRFGGKARSVFIPFSAMLYLYCPRGVVNGAVLGYDQVAGKQLINYITPGMALAMGGAPTTKPEEPETPPSAPRESFLKRVK